MIESINNNQVNKIVMATITPSEKQVAIYNFIAQGTGNAVISAVAGSGKTYTIVSSIKYLPINHSALFLAFNKAIVEELKSRIPSSVTTQTCHSLGWNAIIRKFGRVKLDNWKTWNAMKAVSKAQNWGEECLEYTYMKRVEQLVGLIKVNLAETFAEVSELAEKHEVEILNGEIEKALAILEVCNKDTRNFDYADMLYIPIKMNITLIKYDFVYIDECQDLNKAQQQLMLRSLSPRGRFIAVGDPQQAIYGFAGADVNSFNNLLSIPNTTTFPLSVNYRCGRQIINLAKKIVPQLEHFEGTGEGLVDRDASYKTIKDGDMVLCRNTAPLVKMCLQFLAQQQKAYVKGGDIGINLINLIKKQKQRSLSMLIKVSLPNELLEVKSKLAQKYPYLLDEDREELPAYRILVDKIQVLEAIVDNCDDILTVDNLISKIEFIFSDGKAGICFSTIHKAKGLESENVHIIEEFLMPSKYAKKDWQKVQESNLEYVAYTRAKKTLNFISDWSFKHTSFLDLGLDFKRESRVAKLEFTFITVSSRDKFSISKGDIVRLKGGEQGMISRNASLKDMELVYEGKVIKFTKEDITGVVSNDI